MLSENTYYFYGYPGAAQEDVSERYPFYNRAPFTTVERKVVQRPLSMGLPIVNFSSNNTVFAQRVYELMGIEPKQIYFPQDVEQTTSLLDKDRKIKEYIRELFNTKGIRIQQAQPYTDLMVESIYAPECRDSYLLNDKSRMQERIPEKYLLKRSTNPFSLFPFVAKLARSSAGDATQIITNEIELRDFQKAFGKYNIPIIYEEFCSGEEKGIEFFKGSDKKVQLLGCVTSQIDTQHAYTGGVITKDAIVDTAITDLLLALEQGLQNKQRAGRGGVDVRKGADGIRKIIDPNMRITQVMPTVCDVNNVKDTNLRYLSASMKQSSAITKIADMLKKDLIRLYSFCEYSGMVYLDIGIAYGDEYVLQEKRGEIQKKYEIII